MIFHVDPAWRPMKCVAMLYWLVSKPGPATIAFTNPVFGSIATNAPVKPALPCRSPSFIAC